MSEVSALVPSRLQAQLQVFSAIEVPTCLSCREDFLSPADSDSFLCCKCSVIWHVEDITSSKSNSHGKQVVATYNLFAFPCWMNKSSLFPIFNFPVFFWLVDLCSGGLSLQTVFWLSNCNHIPARPARVIQVKVRTAKKCKIIIFYFLFSNCNHIPARVTQVKVRAAKNFFNKISSLSIWFQTSICRSLSLFLDISCFLSYFHHFSFKQYATFNMNSEFVYPFIH